MHGYSLTDTNPFFITLRTAYVSSKKVSIKIDNLFEDTIVFHFHSLDVEQYYDISTLLTRNEK